MTSLPPRLPGRRGRPLARCAPSVSQVRGAFALSFQVASAATQAQGLPPGTTAFLAGTSRFENPAAPGVIHLETFTHDGGSVAINNGPAGPSGFYRVGPRSTSEADHE